MSRARYAIPAVVVGAGINGLGVVRSLGGAGVPVILTDSRRDQPAMHSRYARKYVYTDTDPEALVRMLEGLADEHVTGRDGQRCVLILTMEESVATVARHYERLASRYHLTLAAPGQLLPLLNKNGVRAVAEMTGARIPKTLRIQSRADLGGIDTLRLPIVVKPAQRDSGYADRFAKAYRLYDHAEARALVQRILPVLPDVVAQEWIEGSDSDLYFCLQYLPGNAQPPVSFVGRKIRSWPPHVGGTASCVAAPEAAAELADSSTRFFRHAGVTGLASMEYKRDRNSGEYVIVEPTVGRTDFQEEVATLNGVNLPLAAYCGALGLSMPRAHRPARPRIWRERMADTKSAQHTPAGSTRVPLNARTVDAIARLSDPGPAMVGLARRAAQRLTRVIHEPRHKNENRFG